MIIALSDVSNYNCHYFWEDILENGIKIRPFNFKESLNYSILGMLIQDKYETSLTYNSNMTNKRKNFTISHELVHSLYHLNDKNKIFCDTNETLSYSYNSTLLEYQAHIGALSILIPELVLISELKKNNSPYLISNKYGVSEKAIYIRLLHQIKSNFKIPHSLASVVATNIMNGNNKKLSIDLSIKLEKKNLYENPFYKSIM